MADGNAIQVSVNGASRQVARGSTVADLIKDLALDPARVAVELNLKVVPRADHARLVLNHGDKLEIVTFVGGG